MQRPVSPHNDGGKFAYADHAESCAGDLLASHDLREDEMAYYFSKTIDLRFSRPWTGP